MYSLPFVPAARGQNLMQGIVGVEGCDSAWDKLWAMRRRVLEGVHTSVSLWVVLWYHAKDIPQA